jgi:hypothetical protein
MTNYPESVWLASILTSLGIKSYGEAKLLKALADAGYKCPKISLKDNIMATIKTIVPGLNIIDAISWLQKAISTDPQYLSLFEALNIIEPLSSIELQQYHKNPNLINAILINIKDINLLNALKEQLLKLKHQGLSK